MTPNLPDTYTIKTATRSELPLVIQWATAEGWNPGIADAECFYAADNKGFFIGLLNGEPIASISAVKYNENFGFIGLYIVRPAFRGRGYGLQLWQRGLNYLQGCNIGLDGVVQQQNNYTQSGFQLAHRSIRYQGIGDSFSTQQPSANAQSNTQRDEILLSAKVLTSTARLVPLSSVPFESITQYDKTLFLAARTSFLQRWISSARHIAIGVVDSHQQLLGYGVLRPCHQGYKIGSLFANTPQFAEAIFLHLKAHVEPQVSFYLDVPEVNIEAVSFSPKTSNESRI